MKKIYKKACDLGMKAECVLCSSDPHSLDGVIIEAKTNRIGIVDGTAPHIEDPKYPVAKDKIINLADALDEKTIKKNKETIIKLVNEKNTAYGKAYSYLRKAGDVFKEVMSGFVKYDINYKADFGLSDIIDPSQKNSLLQQDRLLYSFSRLGLTHISMSEKSAIYNIPADGFTEYIIIKKLSDYINKLGVNHSLILSPLSPEFALGLEVGGVVIVPSSECNDTISFNTYPKSKEFKELKEKHDDYISNAQRQLQSASDFHFKTEEIYSSSMDFSFNNEIVCSFYEKLESMK